MFLHIERYLLAAILLPSCIYQFSPTNAAESAAASFAEVDSRIVGGTAVGSILQTPYQVSVRLRANERRFGNGHICGGSVISQRVVLTAAHCIVNTAVGNVIFYRSASEFTVVMGSLPLYTRTANTLQYNVMELAPHPQFNFTTLVNDVALMFFDGFIPWNWPTVRSIPLNTGASAPGTMCSVSGWGKTETGSIAPFLMIASVPLVSAQQCAINYNYIPNSMLCAGFFYTGNVDACQGDSGGPLECNGLLTGVVSWGNGCGEVGFPGVYANVSYLAGWVVQSNATFNYSHFTGGAGTAYGSSRTLALVMLVGVSLLWNGSRRSG